VYWLPALDVDAPLGELDLRSWREGLRWRVKLLFAAMRHVGEAVGGAGTFLISATRLGGRHGYDSAGAVAPMGGAVAGFTKAFHREHPDALVKAVDFSPGADAATASALLVDETLRDPGALEVGHHDGGRWTIALDEVQLDSELAGVELTDETVFAITGAAGSIVSAITADLARASHGVFHLLDLVPEPDRADADISAFATDKEALKRTIFDRMKAAGERATPAVVEREMARIERAHAALSAIEAIESAGGRVHYYSVDLRDGEAVASAVDRIFERSGRIDVLVHAGGLEVSHLLADKTPEEFDLVFDVKADGWFNLLHAIGDRPLRAAVVFSSVAGRFGNAGQTDYSAANDLLCKEIASLRGTRPDTLGVAIDWTAWADIGMASRGSIPTVMKAAGIDMLPAHAGIPIVRRELTLRQRGGEVVIGQRLGSLVADSDPTGGLEIAGEALGQVTSGHSALFSDVEGWSVGDGLRVVATLDPAEQAFLHDHQIDGTPVLPGVMGIEAFAEAALLLHPERRVAAIEDVAFLAPFKFYRSEPRQLTVTCQFTSDGDDLLARCTLIGTRQLPNQVEPEVKAHFTATVRLATSAAQLAPVPVPTMVAPTVEAKDIYRIYFHGPAYKVLDEASANEGVMVGRLARDLPPSHHPEAMALVTAPRLLELAFQTVGVMEIGTTGTLGLPMSIGRVAFAADGTDHASDPITAVARLDDGGWTATVVDAGGEALVEMSGYRTIALPGALEDDLVTPLRRAVGSSS
jgi:NAD(P)-dependent dehydrogenase (short-subunit alcohol dehydrogenase family)